MISRSAPPAPTTGSRKRWEGRRAEIVDECARIFAAQGYANTGITELCSAVGLGRGAFYYYIESKESLLALIHDRVMEQLLPAARAVRDDDLSPTEALRTLGLHLIGVIVEYPNHVWVFLHEFRALTGDRAVRFRTLRAEYETIIENVIRRGISMGQLRQQDPRLATLAWLGLHNYTYIWYRVGRDPGADRLAEYYAEFALHGLSVADGRRARRARSTV